MDLYFSKEELFEGGILIMLVGPPGAGKSVLAKKIKDSYMMNSEIVCPDDIREEICGNPSDQTHNNEVFSKVYSRLRNLLDNGYNVIYDATNCRSSYRKKIMNVVDGYYKKAICICLLTTLNDCLKNNKSRDRFVPEDIIERMYINFHSHGPNLFEGYDAIIKA